MSYSISLNPVLLKNIHSTLSTLESEESEKEKVGAAGMYVCKR